MIKLTNIIAKTSCILIVLWKSTSAKVADLQGGGSFYLYVHNILFVAYSFEPELGAQRRLRSAWSVLPVRFMGSFRLKQSSGG